MFSRSGYQALPLGDYNHFPQSSIGVYGSQKSLFSFGHVQDPWDQVLQMKGSSQCCLSWICHGIVTSLAFLLMVITFPISGWFVLKKVPAYERMTVFRLGRIRAPQGPGMVLLLPFIDHWQLVDLRTRAFNVPPRKDPVLFVMMVKDLNAAIRMTAQNAMTKTLLKKNLREIQTEKLRIGDQLPLEINDMTKSWGLEVHRVELILEAMLQPSQESLSGPLTMTPPIPGFEGLDSTIQQLAAHFFSNSMAVAAAASPETGSGRIGRGDPERNPDVILEMMENDLQAFFSGELHPLSAYVSGLCVKGDLSIALKLEELFKAMKQRR